MKGALVAATVGVAAWGLTFVDAAVAQLSYRERNTEAFFEAAAVAHIPCCLEAGANIEARDENRGTPLHFAAAKSESPDVVKALLDAGADVEARTLAGSTHGT